MRLYLVLFLLFMESMLNAQGLPKVTSGRIERLGNYPSKYIGQRNIDIWLPEGYDGRRKFDVLYMSDGQMLFDSATTWNHQAWEADNVAGQLMRTGKVRDFIVVGIWNAGEARRSEYCPQKPFERLTVTEQDTLVEQLKRTAKTIEVLKPCSDNFLKFITEELKPEIDRRYEVRKNRNHTYIAGSSFGGLLAIYALCEYPEVFGGAACLSTHWTATHTRENNPFPGAMFRYLSDNLPPPQHHRLYFDCGDQTLDALYPPLQQKVDSLMKAKGYTPENWITHYFPGKDHSERSWHERLAVPLMFLLN